MRSEEIIDMLNLKPLPPGFEFTDFEAGARAMLVDQYPEHASCQLTRQ